MKMDRNEAQEMNQSEDRTRARGQMLGRGGPSGSSGEREQQQEEGWGGHFMNSCFRR